jgi:hypothetical protein
MFLALYFLRGCTADGVPSEGSAKAGQSPMEEEKRGWYTSIGSFVGKDWNGFWISPNPCGQTPSQVRPPQSSFLIATTLILDF